ncbi:MAG: type I DNA topoisomerase [Paludibacteraceae bacterium]|nr:type I DNA topoisomerase [Paludibacteraceae bacterium]
MSKNLVIVESPAKAKTIEKFLGADYHVLSSQGHIRDIEGAGKHNIGIDFSHGYAPNYVLEPSKLHLIDTLRKEAAKAETVWLASDEDREGEAIAWHLKEVLALQPEHTHRIAFHEITESAIKDAIAHPRDIDYNLVNAQQARRVLDRIVGFELSPVLWRKVSAGLSAGRVQSVAVRLVVEREREIELFVPTAQYKVSADFTGKDVQGSKVTLHTELNHRFATEDEARAFLMSCTDSTFTIRSIQKRPVRRTPAPPFTTSLLQQEAARKLHFPVSKTMRLAQSLYEAGHITYMRTDSVNLSSLAIGTAKKQIVETYGAEYHKARNYHTTSKGAQEAHEAIRPTYINHITAGNNEDERKLYDLIRKRALASQMADAELEQTRIEISSPASPYLFVASGEVVLFDGFMRAYVQSTDEDDEQESTGLMPAMDEGAALALDKCVSRESFTAAPQRYNEATLVKKMEELEIGRPSTYATIIETIQARDYVRRGNVPGKKRSYTTLTLKNGAIAEKKQQENVGAESQRLLPTDLGRLTNDFLVEQFPAILSYDFTAKEEQNFDRIAEGKADWTKVVDAFYKTFHPLISQVPTGKIAGRTLGVDPQTGEEVIVRITKNGPCVQIGSAEGEKPRFASLQKGQSIFTITLDEALQLFAQALPITLGEYNGEEVVVADGKYGPYVRVSNTFASLPKGTDPFSMTLENAVALVEQKQNASMPIHDWGEIKVMRGRFGAYIKQGETNYRIPRTTDVEHLTKEDAIALINAAPAEGEPKRRFIRRHTKKA